MAREDSISQTSALAARDSNSLLIVDLAAGNTVGANHSIQRHHVFVGGCDKQAVMAVFNIGKVVAYGTFQHGRAPTAVNPAALIVEVERGGIALAQAQAGGRLLTVTAEANDLGELVIGALVFFDHRTKKSAVFDCAELFVVADKAHHCAGVFGDFNQ